MSFLNPFNEENKNVTSYNKLDDMKITEPGSNRRIDVWKTLKKTVLEAMNDIFSYKKIRGFWSDINSSKLIFLFSH